MASAFHQWEADPLFSAAEVVQDSADRMESVFRLLLHEQSLAHGDNPDPKLLALIEHHRRDLATTLETAKWQLEDFEREVNLSAMSDKSQTKQNVIYRHKQFIRAIGAQIVDVEKTLNDTSVGGLVKNAEWVNLNEQDRDGLAMFLSGGKPVEHTSVHQELEERNILKRFVDPTASSSSNNEIGESNTGKGVKLNMNGVVHSDHNNTDSEEENRIANVGSLYLKQMGSEGSSSIDGIAYDRHENEGIWDLEATEAKSFLYKNKLRGFNSRMRVFGSLGNLMSAYGTSANRSFTKRLKDGEEQRHSSSYNDLSRVAQIRYNRMSLGSGYTIFRRFWLELPARMRRFSSSLGDYCPSYQRSWLSKQLIPLMIFALVLLGLLLLLKLLD